MTTPPRAERRYRSHPATIDRGRHDGGVTLFNAARRSRIELNESGAFIWEQLRTGRSERRVADRLTRKWSLPPEEAAQTVATLADQLLMLDALASVERGAVADHPLDVLEYLVTSLAALSAPAGRPATTPVTGAVDWEAVLATAVRHDVGSALYPALRRIGMLPSLPPRARAIAVALHRSGRLAGVAIRKQILEVVRCLNARRIDVLALKGAGMLIGGELRPGERQIGDVDLLVPAARAVAARNALEAIGYRSLAAPDVDYARHHHLPPLVRGDDEVPVELHLDILPRDHARLLPAHEVWSAARAIECGGARLWLPDPTHQIFHGIVHCAVVDHSYARGVLPLRALLDLTRQREQYRHTADWRFIIERMTECGELDQLRIHLHSAHRFFGMDLPRAIDIHLTTRIRFHRCLAVHGYRWAASLQRLADHFSAESLRRRYRDIGDQAVARARLRLIGELSGLLRPD